MSARLTLIASLALAALGASSAAHAQYTVKLGGAYINPHATSEPLRGGVAVPSPLSGNLVLNDGVALQVQSKSTLIFAIERALDEHWSVEFVLGTPPKHDVKLKVNNPQIDATGVTLPNGFTNSTLQTNASAGLRQKLEAQNGQVVSTVRQWAPTVFFNYKFLDASSSVRPFVGFGINVTRFKARTTAAGDTLYADGAKPEISLSDSIGPAVQVGVSYKLDQNWSLNASVATARVDNKLTIVTASGLRQESSFRFNPTAYTATVGYSF
jgi:outer membrane protein